MKLYKVNTKVYNLYLLDLILFYKLNIMNYLAIYKQLAEISP